MGYTHYWYREREIEAKNYKAMVDDFKKLIPVLERQGVKLADGLGRGRPRIDYDEVKFNGLKNCGHLNNDEIAIAWPLPEAQGIGSNLTDVDGQWFAGRYLAKRCCDGDCSHETFYFPRVLPNTFPYDKPLGEIAYYDMERRPVYHEKSKIGRYFDFCKTAYKPYDWAVTAFLVIAKHYLGRRIIVCSDGTSANWNDARLLCQLELGYGLGFQLDK